MERTAIAGSAPDRTGSRREGAADPATRMDATIVLRPSGGDETAMSAVETFARAHGLKVEDSDAAARSVAVSGSAEQMGHAFGVQLGMFASADGTRHLSYDSAISLPSDIAGHVLAVLGLDTRPVARRH